MKKITKDNKKEVQLNLPKKSVRKKRSPKLDKKLDREVSTVFALAVIIITITFFSIWAFSLNRQVKNEVITALPQEAFANMPKENVDLSNKQLANDGVVYANNVFGFNLTIPKDGKRYAVKEISPKGMDRAVLFGLPFFDDEVKKVKKEDYSEVFRIELVLVSDLGKKTCANKSRQFPLCDDDDRELGRNDQFVYVYTRYDKLDAVEKSKTKLIPADFDPGIFTQADEISQSFRLVDSQRTAENKNI